MKIRNVTPESHLCGSVSCPAIYETDRNSYLVVGKKISSLGSVLQGKVGSDEAVVEVPKGLIEKLGQFSEKGPKKVGAIVMGGLPKCP